MRVLTVVFSRQCSRWWCWLSRRDVDLLRRCSSSVEPWNKHVHGHIYTEWLLKHSFSWRHLWGVQCCQVLSQYLIWKVHLVWKLLELEKETKGEQTGRVLLVFIVQGWQQSAVSFAVMESDTGNIYYSTLRRIFFSNISGAGELIYTGKETSNTSNS